MQICVPLMCSKARRSVASISFDIDNWELVYTFWDIHWCLHSLELVLCYIARFHNYRAWPWIPGHIDSLRCLLRWRRRGYICLSECTILRRAERTVELSWYEKRLSCEYNERQGVNLTMRAFIPTAVRWKKGAVSLPWLNLSLGCNRFWECENKLVCERSEIKSHTMIRLLSHLSLGMFTTWS